MKRQYVISALLIIFISSGCSRQEIISEDATEPTVDRGIPAPDLSIFSFTACYPLRTLDELDRTIGKIQEGLLSIKDLDEPLNEAALSFDTSRMLLASDKLYEDNPEATQFLPEEERANYLQFLDKEYVWFSKTRVSLLDRAKLDIELLKDKIIESREGIDKVCNE